MTNEELKGVIEDMKDMEEQTLMLKNMIADLCTSDVCDGSRTAITDSLLDRVNTLRGEFSAMIERLKRSYD